MSQLEVLRYESIGKGEAGQNEASRAHQLGTSYA